MKKVIITGGAGFIGSTLTERLLSQGIQVTVIDIFSDFYDPKEKELNVSNFLSHPNYTLHRIDIRDYASLIEKVEKHDAIVHIAAKAGVRPSIEDPIGYEEVNVLGTINMLEFAKHHDIKQFVFASSSSVYGTNPEVPWKEDSNIDYIISPYAGTKRSGEIQGRIYSHLYGIRFLALRLFTVFGPKQRPDLAIHKFAKLILNDKPITLYGDGSTIRDYTYVEDIVGAFEKALEYDKSNFEVINVGNSSPISLLELVHGLEKALGKKAEIIHEPEQPGDVPQTYADITKAKELLNYTPNYTVEEGLHNFRDWLITKYSE